MKTNGGFLIFRVKQLQDRAFERLLKRSGIDLFNGAQGRILYILYEHAPMTIMDRRAAIGSGIRHSLTK